jgi:hypothetical protein
MQLFLALPACGIATHSGTVGFAAVSSEKSISVVLQITRKARTLPRASVSSIHFRRGKPFDDHLCPEGELEEHFPLNAFGTVREPLEQIYRSSETTDRISMRIALERLPRQLSHMS